VSGDFDKILAVVKNLPVLGLVESAYAIEKARFPCSIGANDSQYLASPQLETDVLNGDYVPEAQGQVLYFQMDIFGHLTKSPAGS
jgi:hypothetical protein